VDVIATVVAQNDLTGMIELLWWHALSNWDNRALLVAQHCLSGARDLLWFLSTICLA